MHDFAVHLIIFLILGHIWLIICLLLMASSSLLGHVQSIAKLNMDSLLYGRTDLNALRHRLGDMDRLMRQGGIHGPQETKYRWIMAVMTAEALRIEKARVQNGHERKARRLGEIDADWQRAEIELRKAGTPAQVDDYFKNCYKPSRYCINHHRRTTWLRAFNKKYVAQKTNQPEPVLV